MGSQLVYFPDIADSLSIHHMYSRVRILAESTLVVHGEIQRLPSRQLGDMDSDLNIDDEKVFQASLHEIHLEDARSFSGEMHKLVNGVRSMVRSF